MNTATKPPIIPLERIADFVKEAAWAKTNLRNAIRQIERGQVNSAIDEITNSLNALRKLGAIAFAACVAADFDGDFDRRDAAMDAIRQGLQNTTHAGTGEANNAWLEIQLPDAELTAIKSAATTAGKTLPEYVRESLACRNRERESHLALLEKAALTINPYGEFSELRKLIVEALGK